MTGGALHIRHFDCPDYRRTLCAMQAYSRSRSPGSRDAVWLLQHPATFTLGVSSPKSQIPPGDDCVVRTDRGGQITWHGPGQLVGYLMLDLKRLGLGVRTLVERTETLLKELLSGYGIRARGLKDRPGVYTDSGKIAALGFRIRRHFCYHGFSLNVHCDLEAFRRIHPCGIAGLQVCRVADYRPDIGISGIRRDLEPLLCRYFGTPAGSGGAAA